MNSFFYSVLLVAAPILAHSEECPNLRGVYRCDAGRSAKAYPLTVHQREFGNGVSEYLFISPTEGQKSLIADGYEREIETQRGQGTTVGFCSRNRLVVHFRLVNERGEATTFEDLMYKERGALVRLRKSSPNDIRAFVCRPDFSGRKRAPAN